MVSVLHRRTWKSAIIGEFRRKYGLNLTSIVAERFGLGALNELLNEQYEYSSFDRAHDVEKLVRVLKVDFGIDPERLATVENRTRHTRKSRRISRRNDYAS